jgi:hypothetical protein
VHKIYSDAFFIFYRPRQTGIYSQVGGPGELLLRQPLARSEDWTGFLQWKEREEKETYTSYIYETKRKSL